MSNTQVSATNSLLMTVSLAIPTILAAGSAVQAQPISIGESISAPSRAIVKPAQKSIDISQINRFGCPACRSGLDPRFPNRTPIIDRGISQISVGGN